MMKNFTNVVFANNSPMSWAGALITLCIVTSGLAVAAQFLARWLRRGDSNSGSRWHHMATDVVQRTHFLFHLAMGTWAGSQWLTLDDAWRGPLHGGLVAVVLIQVGLWAHRGVKYLIDSLVAQHGDPQGHSAGRRASGSVLRFFSSLVIWSAVFLLVLENVGVNVSALVAGLGVTGVAVALATQNLVSDLFASVSIILDKPFLLGDFIVLDGGFQGTVERIGIRTTRVRSLSGEELVFANSDLSKSRVRNYRTMRERRIVFAFTVRYETPLALLEKISQFVEDAVVHAGSRGCGTRFDRAEMLTFAESGLAFEAVYYVLDPAYNAYTATQQSINFAIMRTFAKHDIQFSYRTMLVLKANDLTESSREMAA